MLAQSGMGCAKELGTRKSALRAQQAPTGANHVGSFHTLLTIGIVSGVAAARDAIIDEFGDVAQAMLALDQSYTIDFPLLVQVHAASTSSASDSSFTDALLYTDCTRSAAPTGQVPQQVLDVDS